MIQYVKGNIFDSPAMAIVNTVNLMGVMGKGIALQFRERFPDNYLAYKVACKNKTIDIGKLFVYQENTIWGNKLIVNFPTKKEWRKSSEYKYIEYGLNDLVHVIQEYEIKSIAIPPLGSGNGGLNWDEVKKIINRKLAHLDIDIFIYEPTTRILKHKELVNVKLTEARALLLYMLFDLVKHGEFVSEFSSEKICYFLQRFGAKDLFKLSFHPKYYGPYSGKVRYVLKALNGSYILGYNDMNCKPFEALLLVPDSYANVEKIILNNPNLLEIANRTKRFLEGFYSDCSLELLSSVDYILYEHGMELTAEKIYKYVSQWNGRKAKIFDDMQKIDMVRKLILDDSFLNKSQKGLDFINKY